MNSEKPLLCQGEIMSVEEFREKLMQILRDELKKGKWEQYLKDIRDELNNGTEEAEEFKNCITNIGEIICNVESYMYDLWADIYMGSLRINKENDVYPDELMEQGWDSKACNNNIDVENAKRHYPMLDYGDEDFPISGIPGGCKEFHHLMMQQKNIGFFDISSKRGSLKQYAFPKTHEIYKELADSSPENLLLLEKTQGIGYTNQLFYYLKDITQKSQMEDLRDFIELATMLPMFIRKDIANEVWAYLLCFDYNDISMEYVKDEIYGIILMVRKIYEKIWRFGWQTVKEGKFPGCALKGTIDLRLRDYFGEWEICDYFNKAKGLAGWKDVERYEDCFIWCGENGGLMFPVDERGEALKKKVNERKERKTRYGKEEKSDKEILMEVIEELKNHERKVWDDVDPKEKTSKLKAMDVYAVIHTIIVRTLNE